MKLCIICNSANCSAFQEGDCHICDNSSLQTDKMAEKAAVLLSNEDAKSFSISTIIPKEWLVNEEDAWDRICREKTESVKNCLNRTISGTLKEKTGLKYTADGDCRLVFDYKKGEVALEKNDLFIFGRYKKHVPGLSQSRWICSNCNGSGCKKCSNKGKNFESVEEKIGDVIKKETNAKEYVMHASGREDVDATNTAGRMFVLRVKEPGKRAMDFEKIAMQIGNSGEVTVEGLRLVGRGFVELVTESHFDKTYRAEIEFGKELDKKDKENILALQGKTLLQRTPARVAHRRADLIRHRKVKFVRIDEMQKNKATITVMAEAGTYIKELVSGDKGRTNPSIAGLLSTTATCTALEVVRIDDVFIEFCLASQINGYKK